MDYRKTAKEYAEIYGVTDRTVKRWKAKDFPLDDEQATRLLIESGASPTSSPVPRPAGSGKHGLTAAIERLRKAELDSHSAYDAAVQQGDRNQAWTPKIINCITDNRPTLIVAGVLHFVGDESIPNLLRRRGFRVDL